MICLRCHRQLRLASPDGYGPVCRKSMMPIPAIERDLFGFNVAQACDRAVVRLGVHIETMAMIYSMALRHDFAAARHRMGVFA